MRKCTGIQLLIVIIDATWNVNACYYAIMKFRMRRRDRYECDVPHPLPLDGKYHMFCSRENDKEKQKDFKNVMSFRGIVVSTGQLYKPLLKNTSTVSYSN